MRRSVLIFARILLTRKAKRRPNRAPFGPSGQIFSGGAGIRTPVRDWIDHSFYVRVSPFSVSGNWQVSGRFPDNPPELSPDAGRRSAGLARYCDTHKAASGGLPYEQVL